MLHWDSDVPPPLWEKEDSGTVEGLCGASQLISWYLRRLRRAEPVEASLLRSSRGGLPPYANAFTAKAMTFCEGGSKGMRGNENLLFLSIEAFGEIF